MRVLFASLVAVVAVIGANSSAAAEGIPKFGSTCVGDYGLSSKICLSSNGKTVSSSYIFRKSIPTKGTHTGCSLNGSSIRCTGGQYRTSQGDGSMNSVIITLKNGKPTAIAWR